MQDVSKLWTPMRGAVTEAKKEAWLRSRAVTFHGFSEWSVPEGQTWREDPFSNNTWKLWYHCLTWLYVPAAIAETNGEAEQLEYVRRCTLDWMAAHGPTYMADPTDMAWDDHAIAYRSTCLVYLYRQFFSDDAVWTAAFRSTMSLHARALHAFLRRPEFIGNNHGVFHCFALLNMMAAVPELDLPLEYKSDADLRLFALLDEMIDTSEGVTREQALEYQYIALELVGEVMHYADFFGLDDENGRVRNLRPLMTRLVDFAFLMRWPDGSVPAVGDTWLDWHGWSVPVWEILERYVAAGYGSDSTKEAIRCLRAGTITTAGQAPDVVTYPRSGYLLAHGGEAGWAMFLKAGPPIHSHGHHDHLNLQLFVEGQLLLVDSGGPYKYSDPQREYFTHPRAHNTVVCRGQSGFSYGVAEEDVGGLATDALLHLGGSHRISDGVRHTRNAVFLQEIRTLVVHDEIVAVAPRELDLEQFWHFAPGTMVSQLPTMPPDGRGPTDFLCVAPNGVGFRIRLVCERLSEVSLVQGQVTPRLQGWVTRKVGTMEAAPTLEVALKTSPQGRASVFLVVWPHDGSERGVSSAARPQDGHSCFVLDSGTERWDFRLEAHRLGRAICTRSGAC